MTGKFNQCLDETTFLDLFCDDRLEVLRTRKCILCHVHELSTLILIEFKNFNEPQSQYSDIIIYNFWGKNQIFKAVFLLLLLFILFPWGHCHGKCTFLLSSL